MILPLGEYRLHGRQGGGCACLDFCIDPLHNIGRESQLLGGFVGSIGIMDVGHYGSQLIQESIIPIYLGIQRKVSESDGLRS